MPPSPFCPASAYRNSSTRCIFSGKCCDSDWRKGSRFEIACKGFSTHFRNSGLAAPENQLLRQTVLGQPTWLEAALRSVLPDIELDRDTEVSRSTFYRYLANQPNLRNPVGEDENETKRFAYKFINELWQADVMHGPRIRDGRRKRETYLICFLDDASRLVPYSGFAFKQDFLTLRHFLKEAVMRRENQKCSTRITLRFTGLNSWHCSCRIWLFGSPCKAISCCWEREARKVL